MFHHNVRLVVGGGRGQKPAAVIYAHDPYLACFAAVAKALQGKPEMFAAMQAVVKAAKTQRKARHA